MKNGDWSWNVQGLTIKHDDFNKLVKRIDFSNETGGRMRMGNIMQGGTPVS